MTDCLTRLSLAAIALPLLYSAAATHGRSPGKIRPDFNGPTIVYTQVPIKTEAAVPNTQSGRSLQPEFFSGARLVLLYPDNTRRVLTEGFHSACDPEISFDGQRILFAGKKTQLDPWHIYEMAADGTEVRQVTQGSGNHRAPVYLSTLYTLISDKPWHQIAFVSDQSGTYDEPGLDPATAIYSCRLDGTATMRVTHTPTGVAAPFLMRDGRLLFAAWRRLLPGRAARLALFGVNIDGTDFALFADEEGRRIKHTPCTTSEGLAVFVESDEESPDGAGLLACVSLRRNLHSYRKLTQPEDGLFHWPSPLPDGSVLVSRRPGHGSGSFGICRLDPSTGQFKPVFDDAGIHDVQARLLAPREEPDGRSTSVLRRTGEIDDPGALEPRGVKAAPEKLPSGNLYCLNAYNSNLLKAEWLPRGTIKRVRLLEGVPMRVDEHPVVPVTPAGSLLRRRFIGEAPVEDDGSFNLQVPADTPIELQLLDADGLALESCAWIWVKNNESRGCIGCHEDGELVPDNRLVKAIAQPSVALTLPPERRRTVDFQHDVMPVITSRCVSCHRAGASRPELDDDLPGGGAGAQGRKAYASLMTPIGPARGEDGIGRYVTSGKARISPLIWHILGRNTSRPWDRITAGLSVKEMPPASSLQLTADEKRAFVEWIDLGAGWSNHAGGRQSLPLANRRSRFSP